MSVNELPPADSGRAPIEAGSASHPEPPVTPDPVLHGTDTPLVPTPSSQVTTGAQRPSRPTSRYSIAHFQAMRERGEKFAMVTAYDYTGAQLLEAAGIPLILVGDSLGMVVQGRDTTIPVTIEQMIYHAQMVSRGTSKALVVTDLPFMSYTGVEQALDTAARVMQETGTHSVKLEGGAEFAETVRTLVNNGVPVCGHLGYTPQSTHQIGVKVQGKDIHRAQRLVQDALALQEAGAWAVVLELVPVELAHVITERLSIPTIGIGAGPHCSGQVQVWHDMLGLYRDFQPRHAYRAADLGATIIDTMRRYADDVAMGAFPAAGQATSMDADVLHSVQIGLQAEGH